MRINENRSQIEAVIRIPKAMDDFEAAARCASVRSKFN